MPSTRGRCHEARARQQREEKSTARFQCGLFFFVVKWKKKKDLGQGALDVPAEEPSWK